MAAYITGSSNYPYDFDLYPTGVGVNPTISNVLDEIRGTNGVITQSGTTIDAIEMNAVYTIIDKLEHVLGYAPEGSYPDVATRLNFIQNSGAGAYLHLSGGNIFGPVNFVSGSSLTVTTLNASGLSSNLLGNSNITGNGALTATFSGNIALNSSGSLTLNSNSLNINNNSTALNTSFLNVNVTGASGFYLGSQAIVFQGPISLIGNIAPSVNNTESVGTTGNYFSDLYVNNIHSTGSAGLVGYVAITGSAMSGTFTLTSGATITNATSGTNALGSVAEPFGSIWTKTLNVTNITGMSPVTFGSNIEFASGSTVGAASTGLVFGSVGNPVTTIYATNIIGATGFSTAGLVNQSGASMVGTLTIGTGSSVVPASSGTSQIGSSGSYFSEVYTNNINGAPLGHLVFNEMLTGTANAVNRNFFLSHAPANGTYANIFISGLYIRPSIDYVLAGNMITLTGTYGLTPPSGSNLVYSSFYIY